MESIGYGKSCMKPNANHIEWCQADYDSKWGETEDCTCPGAGKLRELMEKGLTYEQAKEHVIKNDLF